MSHRQQYGDEGAQRIIARAAEIDADERRKLDAARVRELAANAGISPEAVERALREHDAMAPARAPWPRRYRSALIVAAMIAASLLWVFARQAPNLPF